MYLLYFLFYGIAASFPYVWAWSHGAKSDGYSIATLFLISIACMALAYYVGALYNAVVASKGKSKHTCNCRYCGV